MAQPGWNAPYNRWSPNVARGLAHNQSGNPYVWTRLDGGGGMNQRVNNDFYRGHHRNGRGFSSNYRESDPSARRGGEPRYGHSR